MRSLDNTGENQIALELLNQKALLAQEPEARRHADTKTANAELVAKNLSHQLQLEQQLTAMNATAKQADDQTKAIEERLAEALSAIITMQQDAAVAEERMQKMQTLHAMNEQLIQDQQVMLDTTSETDPI